MALRYAAPLCACPLLRHQAAAPPLRSQSRAWKIVNTNKYASPARLESQSKLALFQWEIRQRSEQFNSRFSASRAGVSFSVRAQQSNGESGERTPNSKRLILYSKQGCCLCDGVKEKLEGIDKTADVQLEVRDTTTNPDWWNAYQYEIPVLTRLRDDGVEVPLPRFSPRLNAEQVQKKVYALMTVAD